MFCNTMTVMELVHADPVVGYPVSLTGKFMSDHVYFSIKKNSGWK